MAANTCKITAKSYDWCPGRLELPGVIGPVYYSPMTNIVDKPYIVRDSYNRPATTELTGQFEMLEGCVFQKIDIQPRKGHYTSEPQGELPSQTQLNKLDVVIPSTSIEASDLALSVNNVPGVFVFRDATGRARVLGLGPYPAIATFAQDGGEDATGTVSSTLHVESVDYTTAPFYNGTIMTADGEINATEGVHTTLPKS